MIVVLLCEIGSVGIHLRTGIFHNAGQLYGLQHGDIVFRISGCQGVLIGKFML